ncbi:MAG: hypothetical protein K0V04_12135 [Deltaproteobacteria bacterium]|nr:hypothetical protein [Deltaproteobacteria bacterium]
MTTKLNLTILSMALFAATGCAGPGDDLGAPLPEDRLLDGTHIAHVPLVGDHPIWNQGPKTIAHEATFMFASIEGPTHVEIQFLDADGRALKTAQVPLPRRGSRHFVMPREIPDGVRSAVLRSDGPLSGVGVTVPDVGDDEALGLDHEEANPIIHRPFRTKAAFAFASRPGQGEGTNESFLPLVMRNQATAGGPASTSIYAQNTSSVPIDVEIELQTVDAEIQLTTVSLAPGAAGSWPLTALSNAGLHDNLVAGARIFTKTPGGRVVALAATVQEDRALTIIEGSPGGARRWSVPLYASRLTNHFNVPVSVQNTTDHDIPKRDIFMECTVDGSTERRRYQGEPEGPGASVAVSPGGSYFFNPVPGKLKYQVLDNNGQWGPPVSDEGNWYGPCVVSFAREHQAGLVFVQNRVATPRTGTADDLGLDTDIGATLASPMPSVPVTDVPPIMVPWVERDVSRTYADFSTALTVANTGPTTASVVISYIGEPGQGDFDFSVQIPPRGNVLHNHRDKDHAKEMPDDWRGSAIITATGGTVDVTVQQRNEGVAGDSALAHGGANPLNRMFLGPLWDGGDQTQRPDVGPLTACDMLRTAKELGDDYLTLGMAIGLSGGAEFLSGWIPDAWIQQWGGADAVHAGLEVVWDMYHHEAMVARWRGNSSSVGAGLKVWGAEVDTYAAFATGFANGVESWLGPVDLYAGEVEVLPEALALMVDQLPIDGGISVGLSHFRAPEPLPHAPAGVGFNIGLELESSEAPNLTVPSPLGALRVTPELTWAQGQAVLAKAETRALYGLIRLNTLGLVDVQLVDASSGAECLALEPQWPYLGAHPGAPVSSRDCVLSFGDNEDTNTWRNLQATAGMCAAIGYLPCFTNLGRLPVGVSAGLATYRDAGAVVDAVCGSQ